MAWVEGEAGAGKTTLVRQLLARLPAGFTVVRAEADELASDIPYAVAAQLGPVRAAEPFRAGLELLNAFSRRQKRGPVAVLVEDLHWADLASRQALLAAGRRLGDDRVLLLVTSRPAAQAGDGWERFAGDQERCLRITLGALSAQEWPAWRWVLACGSPAATRSGCMPIPAATPCTSGRCCGRSTGPG